MRSVAIFDLLSPPSIARSNASLAALHRHCIYLIGGQSEESSMKSCECYDVNDREWRAAPSLNIARHGHSSCSLNSTIYCFFGRDKKTFTQINEIEMLNAANSNATWQIVNLGEGSA